MTCGWIEEAFHCVEFSAPFVIEKDISYYPDLSNKYRVLLKRASGAGADDDSLAIIEKYSKKVLIAFEDITELIYLDQMP